MKKFQNTTKSQNQKAALLQDIQQHFFKTKNVPLPLTNTNPPLPQDHKKLQREFVIFNKLWGLK